MECVRALGRFFDARRSAKLAVGGNACREGPATDRSRKPFGTAAKANDQGGAVQGPSGTSQGKNAAPATSGIPPCTTSTSSRRASSRSSTSQRVPPGTRRETPWTRPSSHSAGSDVPRQAGAAAPRPETQPCAPPWAVRRRDRLCGRSAVPSRTWTSTGIPRSGKRPVGATSATAARAAARAEGRQGRRGMERGRTRSSSGSARRSARCPGRNALSRRPRRAGSRRSSHRRTRRQDG